MPTLHYTSQATNVQLFVIIKGEISDFMESLCYYIEFLSDGT